MEAILQDQEYLRLLTQLPHDAPIFCVVNTHTTEQIHKQYYEQQNDIIFRRNWSLFFLEEAQLVLDRWQHTREFNLTTHAFYAFIRQ